MFMLNLWIHLLFPLFKITSTLCQFFNSLRLCGSFTILLASGVCVCVRFPACAPPSPHPSAPEAGCALPAFGWACPTCLQRCLLCTLIGRGLKTALLCPLSPIIVNTHMSNLIVFTQSFTLFAFSIIGINNFTVYCLLFTYIKGTWQ